jgi:hypothetical protein
VRVRLAFCAVMFAGCSTAAPTLSPAVMPHTIEEDREEAFEGQEQMIAFESQIDELAAIEDCAGACEMAGRVCSLGERICTISERHPGDTEIGSRCRDGRTRCERARRRLAEECTCPPAQ